MICTAHCNALGQKNHGIDFISYITQYDTVYLAKELKSNGQITLEITNTSSKDRMEEWCWWWKKLPDLVGSNDGIW